MLKEFQINLPKGEYRQYHREEFRSFIGKIRKIFPNMTSIKGYVSKSSDTFEGKLKIRTRAGMYFAKARSRSLINLIIKLQTKVLRQSTNWREKKRSKNKYQRRRYSRIQDIEREAS